MIEKLTIGSRGSDLALWQANFVKYQLNKLNKELKIEIKIIKTTGDKVTDSALSEIGDKGLFTKEIEKELLDKEIDMAVHSLKDLQTILPEGIELGAVIKRQSNEDVLIAKKRGITIRSLRKRAVVATGSLRRKSQLLHLRPDLKIVDLRGNVPTRIQKFKRHDWDGMILAKAGLERLNLTKFITQVIPKNELLPAVGQGAIAVEIHTDNEELKELLKNIHHEDTFLETQAERALLRTLEGGCQVPIGANAEVTDNKLVLDSFIGSADGILFLRKKIEGNKSEAEKLGVDLAKELLNAGAGRILEGVRGI